MSPGQGKIIDLLIGQNLIDALTAYPESEAYLSGGEMLNQFSHLSSLGQIFFAFHARLYNIGLDIRQEPTKLIFVKRERAMTINTAEKIETIVLSRSTGTFGSFTQYAPGKFRVEADGLTVLARCDELGWHVSFKSFEGIDRELYVAAQMALDAGKGANATRHADLGGFIAAWS